MTQLKLAQKGKITFQMRKVAKDEGVDPEIIREKVASGRAVILYNSKRNILNPKGIGEGLKTKVNANIGTSSDSVNIKAEIKKMKVSEDSGADTIMDLSTGGNLKKIRAAIMRNCSVPVGTVPIYEAAVNAVKRDGSVSAMKEEEIFDVIESQAKEGIDFFTVHCGITRQTLERLKQESRITDIVSRGGAIIVNWMVENDKENPLYENFDKLLQIAKLYDVTLSLGDGMRPGSIADATDRVQIQELIILGELAKRAQAEGIQVMIEGPGHIPINQIEANVILEKKLCHGAPFYVLGPLVTDIAPGYDHITAAIGGALAASYGADFLCYVTASEHLRIPDLEDVREGVIVARIAAHAADIAKGIKGALNWDLLMSKARKKRDWKRQIALAIDPQIPSRYRKNSRPKDKDVCTMCSEYCALKLADKCNINKVQ